MVWVEKLFRSLNVSLAFVRLQEDEEGVCEGCPLVQQPSVGLYLTSAVFRYNTCHGHQLQGDEQ